MEQTEDKIKQIYCWNGYDILPLPFHRVFPKKQTCVCDRVPKAPFCGHTSDIEEDCNRRIREETAAIGEDYDFLSNFYVYMIKYKGVWYQSAET